MINVFPMFCNNALKKFGSRHRQRIALYDFYFDQDYYKGQYPQDVEICKKSGIELLDYFIAYGRQNERNPSKYFNTKWYLQNAGPLPEGVEPLSHYIQRGWRSGVSPNKYFDVAWYLNRYNDVRNAGVEPLKHFISYGQFEDRRVHPDYPNSYFLGYETASETTIVKRSDERSVNFTLSLTPLVSVIITNMNGYRHLKDLFDSLDAQTYRNFEVIFVDDDSEDDSVNYAESRGAHVIKMTPRVGFAQANNEGLKFSKGELIALLNNDMRCDANWLESMVVALKKDRTIGAIAPLIRFWSKFQRIELSAATPFSLNVEALSESLDYKKYFVRQGCHSNIAIDSCLEGVSHRIVIDLPLQSDPLKLTVEASRAAILSIKIAETLLRKPIIPGVNTIDYRFSTSALKTGFFIVNNAGSIEIQAGQPADRGFGDVDEGQYFKPESVAFLCGGATLIRRDALHGRELFVGAFVAYYEDSELSVRLRRDGHKIYFEPLAIVYHRHSATNVEHSAFWRKYTFRNKILFNYLTSSKENRDAINHQARAELNHLAVWYRNQSKLTPGEFGFLDSVPSIDAELTELFSLIDNDQVPKNSGLRIGVFNPYWNTLGGGEAHALSFAHALGAKFGQVELISERDFDIDFVLNFFGASELNARKRLVCHMTPEISSEYDIFVNSAYQNEMPSKAKYSYFIISFPSKTPSGEFLQSYRFLANSNFTLSWAKRYWGDGLFNGDVLHPSIPDEFFNNVETSHQKSDHHVRREFATVGARYLAKAGRIFECYLTGNSEERSPSSEVRERAHGLYSYRHKSKMILNVGRFTASGHTKNQKEIAQVFNELVEENTELTKGWQLVLLGSSNDENYLQEVNNFAQGANIRIVLDAPYEDLLSYYAQSAIYVHASGFGRDPEFEPELFEHFGIAVAQGVASGCVPLVYGAAGPKEIIDTVGDGWTFSTLKELKDELRVLIEMENHGKLQRTRLHLQEKAQQFSRRAQCERLIEMFNADIGDT